MTPRLIWLCVVLHLVPAVSGAQGTSADDVVTFLVLNQAVPTGDFTKDAQAADATRETLTSRGVRFTWYDELQSAIHEAARRSKAGDLLLLIGAQAMDRGRELLEGT